MHIAELLINAKKNVIYKEMNFAYLVTFNPIPVTHLLEQSKSNTINMSTLINSSLSFYERSGHKKNKV